jgi:HlyD family secretion protein
MSVATDASIASSVEPRAPVETHRWILRWRLVLVGALALAAVTAALLWPRLVSRPAQPETVTASGRIEGREVSVAAKDIQGRVKRLFVDEGQTVTQGQLLAELDAAPLEARATTLSAAIATIDVQIHQALLDVELTAKSNGASVAGAEAGVSSAAARVARMRAILANADADHQRSATLYDGGAISKRDFDQAEMSYRTSEADVDAAEKDLARAEAELALARATTDTVALKRQQVRALQENRRAAVGQFAELQATLAERQVLAPTDGTILSRPVEVGDVVTPGAPIFQMVDMSRLYVKVYVPEPDIPKLKLDDPADVYVDAFRGHAFGARISKIHQEAEFTPKNVETTDERLKLVFGVELRFVQPDSRLKPGMPADCVIRWTPAHGDGAHRGT